MYCHGLGDCFLVTLPRSDGLRDAYRIMIDCGVLLGTDDAEVKMQRVVRDIANASDGHVDLLIVTHEHWDHVSGFLQATKEFAAITFGQVWMGWTESPTDAEARELDKERGAALTALRSAESRLRLAGAAEVAEELGSLLTLFGAGKGNTTRDAREKAKSLAPGALRYVEPGEAPEMIEGTGARLYVLGPPRDRKLLLRSDPSRKGGETYGVSFGSFGMEELEASLGGVPKEGPFADRMTIPMTVARAMPEFHRYWADGAGGAGEGEDWRRIDGDWLDAATDLGLCLDHDTNNSSLVVAIELANGEVLLFAADAQVGNWQSWQSLKWSVDGREVTGPDLLRRAVFYKVGHHGSHNATLREGGLETMEKLRVAAIPVDEVMARSRRWTRMPLPALIDELTKRTGGRVLRSDQVGPGAPLFIDITP
jgi:hypothetical protein